MCFFLSLGDFCLMYCECLVDFYICVMMNRSIPITCHFQEIIIIVEGVFGKCDKVEPLLFVCTIVTIVMVEQYKQQWSFVRLYFPRMHKLTNKNRIHLCSCCWLFVFRSRLIFFTAIFTGFWRWLCHKNNIKFLSMHVC